MQKIVTTEAGQLEILKAIDLQIQAGETVAIIGASGSGKTTLLGLLAGLDVPSHGQIFIDDTDITTLDEEQRAQLRGRLVGFVFQSFQLLPSLTALENVMLPAELRGDTDALAQAKALLDHVELSQRLDHYPRQLSGGEQQRVAIARAFAAKPQILFADEPTGNLDTNTGQRIVELLFDLNRSYGTTLVLVTHDQQLAQRCHRQLQITAGELVVDSNSSSASLATAQ